MMEMEKVTLTLPKDLMAEVRTLTPPRGQSRFVAEAIRAFLEAQRRRALRERLIAGYQANAAADAALADEWAAAEDEAWLTYVPAYTEGKLTYDTPTYTTG